MLSLFVTARQEEVLLLSLNAVSHSVNCLLSSVCSVHPHSSTAGLSYSWYVCVCARVLIVTRGLHVKAWYNYLCNCRVFCKVPDHLIQD